MTDASYIKGLTLLPDHMRGGMRRYIEKGIPPGSFLEAVLSNDLMGALAEADATNRHALPAYGRYLYNDVPSACHGSSEKVEAWIGTGGLAGREQSA